jgi:hypothetical protein
MSHTENVLCYMTVSKELYRWWYSARQCCAAQIVVCRISIIISRVLADCRNSTCRVTKLVPIRPQPYRTWLSFGPTKIILCRAAVDTFGNLYGLWGKVCRLWQKTTLPRGIHAFNLIVNCLRLSNILHMTNVAVVVAISLIQDYRGLRRCYLTLPRTFNDSSVSA